MQARNIVLLDNAKLDLQIIRLHIYQVSHSRQVSDSYIKKLRRGLRHLAYTAEACHRHIANDGTVTECRYCPIEHVGRLCAFRPELRA